MTRPSTASSGSRVVSATYAARNFASLVTRVREEAASYVVERSGKPVAEIGPVKDRVVTLGEFAAVVRAASGRPADEEYLKAVEEGIAFLSRAETGEGRWDS